MRKFNQRSFKWREIDKKRGPKPFPGVFPTRWRILVKYRGNKNEKWKWWNYFGKPAVMVARKLSELMKKNDGMAWVGELDRGGYFQYATSYMRNGGHSNTTDHNAQLMRYYYPFNYYDGVVGTNWVDGRFKSRVKWAKGTLAYSSLEPPIPVEYLQELKRWLESQKWLLRK